MKKLITTTVLLATLTAVNAQDKAQPAKPTKSPAVMEQRADARANKEADPLIAELGLNETQVQKLNTVNERHAKAVAELQRSGLEGEALQARSNALQTTRDNDLKGLLTAEQFELMIRNRDTKKPERSLELKDPKAAPSK